MEIWVMLFVLMSEPPQIAWPLADVFESEAACTEALNGILEHTSHPPGAYAVGCVRLTTGISGENDDG